MEENLSSRHYYFLNPEERGLYRVRALLARQRFFAAPYTAVHFLSLIYNEAQFLVPDWRDKVDYGIGLSYRPAKLHRLAGRYDNPMLDLTLYPQSGTKNLATGCIPC